MDVGSIEFVHRRIVHERDQGTAVVIISSELDEVLGLADRIAVMYRGKVSGILEAGATREEIGLLMAGAAPTQAAAAQVAAETPFVEDATGEPV